MDMKNSSVEFENNFAEDFYKLLQSVIQNDVKALAKSDKHFNDVTKQTRHLSIIKEKNYEEIKRTKAENVELGFFCIRGDTCT